MPSFPNAGGMFMPMRPAFTQRPPPSDLAPLQLSDFTLLGAFRPPDPTGDLVDFGSGLALRRVSGTPYLYSLGYSGNCVEYAIPTDGNLHDGGGYVTATVVGQYGDIFQTALYQEHSDGGSPFPNEGIAQGARANNLFWDETDSRMYWTRYSRYDNDSSDSESCIGYSTMNFGAKTGTGVATWKLAHPGSTPTDGMTDVGDRWVTGVAAIPTGFANAYLGGRRLLVGFGDPSTSIVSNGPVCMGPAAFAISPSELNPALNRDYFGGTLQKLIFHPYKSSIAAPLRKTRPNGYLTNSHQSEGYDSSNLYVSWNDQIRGGVWIRGTKKEGLLIPSFGSLGLSNTTISASPTPTNTVFTVASATGIEIGDLCFHQTVNSQSNGTYPFCHAVVTNISGTQITVSNVVDAETTNPDSSIGLAGGFFFTGSRYIGGGPVCSRVTSLWYIYSTAALALAAQGTTLPSAVTPFDEGFVDQADLTFPVHNVQDLRIIGCAFDSVANRFYLAVQNVPSIGGVLINVYSVNC